MSVRSLLRRPSVFLALGLCAVAAVTTLLGRLSTGPDTESKRTSLPDVNGAASFPAFSPDGNRLAYSLRALSGNDAAHIVVRRLPTGAPQQLTDSAANDSSPAWAPDGAAVAFIRTQEERAQLIVMAAAGGGDRVLADFVAPRDAQSLPALSWAHDGKALAATIGGDEKQAPAIALIDASSGAVKRITTPTTPEGDWNPMFSPDGSKLAFLRATSGGGDIFTCARDGTGLRQLTFDNRPMRALAWMPNGRELLFSSDRMRDFMIWRMPVDSASPRATLLSPHAQYLAVAPAGHRVAFTESPVVSSVWRAALNPNDPVSVSDRPLLRSQGSDSHPTYSPDGKKIAFLSDATGTTQIWIADSEGANRVQISKLADVDVRQPKWSPDGKWLLYEISTDQGWDAYRTAPSAGAEPKRVVAAGGDVAWAHDGKSIFYQLRGVIYQANLDGGDARAVTPERRGRADVPMPSADGKYLYYRMGRSIWRVSVKGGDPEVLFEPGAPFLLPHLEAGPKGIYFEEFEQGERAFLISMYNFETKRIARVLRLDVAAGRGRGFGDVFRSNDFSVSPDGKYLLHPQIDQTQTNVIVVDNFK